jgi:hypothetical protein
VNGGGLVIKSIWENIGNAPVYDAFRVSYRLRRNDGAIGQHWINTTSNLKNWLPGDGLKTDTLTDAVHDVNWQLLETPADIYKLDVAILWPKANNPAIDLAIAGRRTDGWYEVSEMKIVNQRKVQAVTVPTFQSAKNNVVDNNMATKWHNSGIYADGWVQLELDKARNINRIGYTDQDARSLSIATKTELDGVWTTVTTTPCIAGGSTTSHSYCSFPATTAKYIKVYLDYGSQNVNPNNVWMVPADIQVLEVPAFFP